MYLLMGDKMAHSRKKKLLTTESQCVRSKIMTKVQCTSYRLHTVGFVFFFSCLNHVFTIDSIGNSWSRK